MPIHYTTSAATVGNLFAGEKIYRLPEFQRPFSWTDDRAAQLFEDLQTAHVQALNGPNTRDGIEYFLGALIVAQHSSRAPHLIIDGQQRLVTLLAILAVIRDRLPPGPFRTRLQDRIQRPADAAAAYDHAPRIELRDIDQDCFERWVIADGGTERLPAAPDTRSTARLLEALNALKSDFPFSDNNFIQGLATFVLNHCGVVLITASSIEDAYRLFKSVNNPGEPLSALALARTELLGPRVHDARHCAELAQAWDEIHDQIGDEQFESYVRTVAALVLPGIEKKDLFDIVREISRDAQLSRSFNDKLKTFLLSYRGLDTADIDFGSPADNARINRHIACILNVPFEHWRPAALYWLSKSLSPRDNLRFFRALDGLCLGLTIQGYKASVLAGRFKSVMSHIGAGTVLARATSPLYLTDAEWKSIRDKISKPIKKATYLKHLLLRLNVAATDINVPPFFPKDVEIEHILPQKPRSTGEWYKLFGNDSERAELTYLLGNMTLLTPTKNKSVSNMNFSEKKNRIFSLSENNCFALTANVANFPDWTSERIRHRQNALLKHAADIMEM